MKNISVVITAFNKHNELLNSLAGFEVQITENPFIETEIFVIDNGSSPPLETVFNKNFSKLKIKFIQRPPKKRNFRPGSARNIGIDAARGEYILFIDGDCIPSPNNLSSHTEKLISSSKPIVTLSHRVFIDKKDINPEIIILNKCNLDFIQEISSSSNYWLPSDRRLEEFKYFHLHPMPFNCCHGCNIGVRKEDIIKTGGFDLDFDGYWGYEDIEFGYRLWKIGAKFEYLANGYVYHQENGVVTYSSRRTFDAKRNYNLACKKIPNYRSFRRIWNRSYYHKFYSL